MSIRHFFVSAFAVVAVASLGSLNVFAADANFDASLSINGSGDLSVSVSGAACDLTSSVSTSTQQASCTISGLQITDLRGTGVGWTSNVTVENFHNAAQNYTLALCDTAACAAKRLSVDFAAIQGTSGLTYGVTDTTDVQEPSALTNTSSTGTNSPAFSLTAFNLGLEIYGRAQITNQGSGYTEAPTVSFSSVGCDTAPVATASVAAGKVTDIIFSTAGRGCDSAPVITLTPTNGGTGAAASALAGAGEGVYTKATDTNGFTLTIPPLAKTGTYTSTITLQAS